MFQLSKFAQKIFIEADLEHIFIVKEICSELSFIIMYINIEYYIFKVYGLRIVRESNRRDLFQCSKVEYCDFLKTNRGLTGLR